MRIPVIQGLIERRVLINFRVEPTILERILPLPFRPKLVNGMGIAGICLIRLRHIRPRLLPKMLGISSENAAHRIAVVWEEAGKLREGVFIPRRDTSSRLNAFVGGHLFPGEHHRALFDVIEAGDRYSIQIDSGDDQSHVSIQGHIDTTFPPTSIFGSLQAASDFFEAGSLGYSVTSSAGVFDGLELRTLNWQMQPFTIDRLKSSYFDDRAIFPSGTIEFDNALFMEDVAHEWHGRAPLCAWSMEPVAG